MIRYHPEAANYDLSALEDGLSGGQSGVGVYPCCEQKVLRFDPTQPNTVSTEEITGVQILRGPQLQLPTISLQTSNTIIIKHYQWVVLYDCSEHGGSSTDSMTVYYLINNGLFIYLLPLSIWLHIVILHFSKKKLCKLDEALLVVSHRNI